MKGQTQAVTAVLITSVTVGAIASAYVWGTPLLEKRQSSAELQQVKRSVMEVRDSIMAVKNGGSGTSSSVTLEIPEGRIEIREKRDIIDVFTQTQSNPYSSSWSTLKGGSPPQNLSFGSGDYASKETDIQGVVAVKSSGSGDISTVQYRIEFRNMYTDTPSGPKLESVDIVSPGRNSASGTVTLDVSNQGTESDSIKIGTGETLPREKTVVEVDFS